MSSGNRKIRIYRAGRSSRQEMMENLQRLWGQCQLMYPLYMYVGPESIYVRYRDTAESYGLYSGILYHAIGLIFSPMDSEDTINMGINAMINYLKDDYQVTVFYRYLQDKQCPEVLFIINAVSYRTGRKWHDNNSTLEELYAYLNTETDSSWDSDIGNAFNGVTDTCLNYQSIFK